MTILEAMSLSKPCVVTDAGGNAEIVVDKQTGLVTDNDDSSKFAEAIVALLNSKALRQEYGEAGYLRYKQEFSTPQMTYRYERIYHCLFDVE